MARARLVSARGSILTSLPSTLAATSLCSATASAPLGPFTLTTWPSTLAVTPEGIATGFFPTRDMAAGPLGCLLERSLGGHARPRIAPRLGLLRFISKDGAENFSAHIVVARIVIGHHTLGCRQYRNPQSIVHTRKRPDRGIDPPPRLRYPRNLADHR